MRQLAGVIVKDLPRYVSALARHGSREYLRLCNRGEQLESAPEGEGVRCNWQWTTDLRAPGRLPPLASWLMRRALADHPVRGAAAPQAGTPRVSFIIGHRGEERVSHLQATLASIAAQEHVAVECIVVHQECGRALTALPAWVTVVHTPPSEPSLPFCRSWAFNVGAAHARGDVLVLHDNDMLVPVDYAAQISAHVDRGWEVADLKRFIFYLGERHTRDYFASKVALLGRAPYAVVQNAQAGASVAITRDGFERIGGMDESFVGWGGEDNEFWDRAVTLRTWHWANLPMVHLWHPSQPGKHEIANPTRARYQALSRIAPLERIAALRQRQRGRLDGPFSGSEQMVEEIA
jgi:hypothetical protein